MKLPARIDPEKLGFRANLLLAGIIAKLVQHCNETPIWRCGIHGYLGILQVYRWLFSLANASKVGCQYTYEK